jgi:uncharacterized membrane protein
MRIALIICGTLVALVALILIIGALLPRSHRALRQITLHQPVDEVYAIVRDFGSAPTWRRDLTRVELLEARLFREHSKNGTVTYEILAAVPNTKLVTRIADRNLGYSGSWTYEFLAEENRTRVRITEDGEISNILFRFMSRFVFGQTSTIDAYLTALALKFGETANPE